MNISEMLSRSIDVSKPISGRTLCWEGETISVRDLCSIDKVDTCSVKEIVLSTHAGTHVDVPAHFIKDGKTLDMYSVLDFSGSAYVEQVTHLDIIDRDTLAVSCGFLDGPPEILIFKTKNSFFPDDKKFRNYYAYISLDAAEWIISMGFKAVGIDYLSIGGYDESAKGAEVHRLLLKNNVLIIENLNLKNISMGYYDLLCFPLNIFHGDGAPARVLLIPDKTREMV